ncbi:MAG: TIGR03435 family protein [Terriglobales bacterium]
MRPRYAIDPAGCHIAGFSLRVLIIYAYGIQNFQLAGDTGWERSRAWEIDAKTSRPATPDEIRLMLRAALGERFGLRLGRRTTKIPALALVVAPTGPKLQPLKVSEGPYLPDGSPMGTWNLPAMHTDTLRGLVGYLNQLKARHLLSRQVVDKTGLDGRFNIWLELPPMPGAGGPARPDEREVPAALKRELGLELVPATASADFYTIASAHMPTPN